MIPTTTMSDIPTSTPPTARKHIESASVLLDILDARSRDVIERRFGIKNGAPETLESIGKEYGITRERVRQIEVQAKKALARREDLLQEIDRALRDIFAAHGGILSDAHLNTIVHTHYNGAVPLTLVYFFLDILPSYEYVRRSHVLASHWSCPPLAHEYIEATIAAAEKLLMSAEHPQPESDLIRGIRQHLMVDEHILPTTCIVALLMASRQIRQTVFGEWGLAGWAETTPRGVGDKAYAVLRRHGKPEHFRKITTMINEARFDHKRAHEQTVHNELIKDSRFVLVGRGMYGLTEWGYIPGTVADVLETILTRARRPMTREELMDQVLAQRLVKKTTILLGLQNSARFVRVKGNRYTLKE